MLKCEDLLHPFLFLAMECCLGTGDAMMDHLLSTECCVESVVVLGIHKDDMLLLFVLFLGRRLPASLRNVAHRAHPSPPSLAQRAPACTCQKKRRGRGGVCDLRATKC